MKKNKIGIIIAVCACLIIVAAIAIVALSSNSDSIPADPTPTHNHESTPTHNHEHVSDNYEHSSDVVVDVPAINDEDDEITFEELQAQSKLPIYDRFEIEINDAISKKIMEILAVPEDDLPVNYVSIHTDEVSWSYLPIDPETNEMDSAARNAMNKEMFEVWGERLETEEGMGYYAYDALDNGFLVSSHREFIRTAGPVLKYIDSYYPELSYKQVGVLFEDIINRFTLEELTKKTPKDVDVDAVLSKEVDISEVNDLSDEHAAKFAEWAEEYDPNDSVPEFGATWMFTAESAQETTVATAYRAMNYFAEMRELTDEDKDNMRWLKKDDLCFVALDQETLAVLSPYFVASVDAGFTYEKNQSILFNAYADTQN